MPIANSLLSEAKFTAFDLETTGLSPATCRIVEFGAVRFRADGAELDRYEQLTDPGLPIPRRATRIHGISDAMVRGKPTVEEALPSFLEFLGDEDSILLAHNAPFDLGFLDTTITQCGLKRITNPVIDTLRLAQRCIRGSASYRLEDLAIHLRLAEAEDHRALSDSLLVMGLFRAIVGGTTGLKTVRDLLSLTRPLRGRPAARPIVHSSVNARELMVAVEQQRTIVMVYDGGTKGLSDRRVTLRSLVESGRRTYLIAYCHQDEIEKSFRVDRVVQFRIDES